MELVLYYNPLPLADPARLRSLLAARGAELRVVPAARLGQPIGFLAGLPGARELPQPSAGAVGEPVMIFCGFSQERLDAVLDALRTSGAPAALKAVLTPTNRSWTFARLAGELQAERAEIAKNLNKGG